MNKSARLLIADVWLDAPPTSEIVDKIGHMIRQEFSVLQEFDHQYTPYGLTKVLILSESHCVIHTYPEDAHLSLDLFACNPEKNLQTVLEGILSKLPVKNFRSSVHDRG